MDRIKSTGMIEWLIDIDTQLFLFLNGIHSPTFDTLMFRISGNLIWAPLYIGILYLLFNKYGLKGLWLLLGIALVVTLADQISVHFFKNVFERLRPCHNPEIKELVHTVSRCGGKYGFVSSHAANTFGVAMFLHLVLSKKWFSISIFLWASLVSYSRIYLGVHYPGDIIVGALLGLTLGKVVHSLYTFIISRIAQQTFSNTQPKN